MVTQQKGVIKLKKKSSVAKQKEVYVSPREEFKMASVLNFSTTDADIYRIV